MSLNAPRFDHLGEDIHIGVVDTLGDPPQAFHTEHDVTEVYDDYVPIDEDDPHGHGTSVLNLATSFAPDATYSTYQVFQMGEKNGEEEPVANPSDVIDAVTDAGDEGVDILNLSLGLPHECGGLCSLSREIELVADVDDVTIFAATGNDDSGKRVGVHCPAMLDAVIGVGGYAPYCRHKPTTDGEASQWWLQDDEEEKVVGPFCGQTGCAGNSECEDYREETLWGGNVSFHNTAPDILAPVFDLIVEDSHVQIQSGTSFATPISAGLLASLLSDLRFKGKYPSNEAIRSAVYTSATEIDSGGYGKFNVNGTWDELV